MDNVLVDFQSGIECIDTAIARYLIDGYLPDEDIICEAK